MSREITSHKVNGLEKIEYTKDPDNCREVVAFVGDVPPCPTCGDYGEYETVHGPAGCMPCCSRLVPFIDHKGDRAYADWGDVIERREDGLHLVQRTGNATIST
jgi:hypothetical protein